MSIALGWRCKKKNSRLYSGNERELSISGMGPSRLSSRVGCGCVHENMEIGGERTIVPVAESTNCVEWIGDTSTTHDRDEVRESVGGAQGYRVVAKAKGRSYK